MRAKSNRIREGNCRFHGRRKGKEKSFCFVVVQFELVFRHPCFYVVCACIEFFGEVGRFTFLYQSPSAVYQSPSAVYQSPSGVYQSPSAVYQSPSGVYQSPSAVYQSTSAVYQSLSAVYQSPSGVCISHLAVCISHLAVCINHLAVCKKLESASDYRVIHQPTQ